MTMRTAALLMAVALLAGCAGDLSYKRGEKYAMEGDWDRAVIEYRQALRDDPENVAYKTRLTKAVDMAATKHIERANYYLREDNPDAALYEAQQALMFSPANNKAEQLVGQATRLRERHRHMAAGKNYLSAGRLNEALDEFYLVLDADPSNPEAKRLVEDITKRKVATEEDLDELSLASDEPVTLSFKEAKLKEVFEFLSKLSGISILFDEDVKQTQTVTVFAKDVSFRQALNLLLATNKLFYKKVSDDTIIVIPKTKTKQAQYQDLVIKTFYLSNSKAKDMVNIIRTMLETRKVIINEPLNSITVRETPEKIALCEKLIEANDKKDAEVVIDVEVLSVERGTGMTYGINLPKGGEATYMPGGVAPSLGSSGFPPVVTSVTEFLDGSKSAQALKDNIYIAYPSVKADWLKTKGNAETLTNPQIRTLNNMPAKILIGQRVPIQTGVTQGTTTTTTFEYREVGIKLNVEPNISLANDITLKTQLEVSDIGNSIDVGGSIQPTITTTTVEATLNLRDGETVIIGGLLENRTDRTVSGVLGLIDVPVLGKIFSTTTLDPTKNKKRELVMTLTPHIVRSMEIPRKGVTEFWSGTDDDYASRPIFEVEKKRPYEGAAEPLKEYEMPEATGEVPKPAPAAAPPAAVKPPAPEAEEEKPGTEAEGQTPAEEKPAATGEGQKPETAAAEPEKKPFVAQAQPAPQKPGPAPVQPKQYRVGKISFAPEVTPIDVGQEVTIDVVVDGVDELYEAPLSIIYNPKLVEFVSAAEGNVLNSDGAPTSFSATANDRIGLIEVKALRLGRVPGVSGSGTLFSLTLKGKAPGISPLVFKQNTLKNRDGGTVPADLKTGTLYIR